MMEAIINCSLIAYLVILFMRKYLLGKTTRFPPHDLGVSSRLCVCVWPFVPVSLSHTQSSTKLSSSPVTGRCVDNLEDPRNLIWPLRYTAELGMPVPLYSKLFLDCDCVVIKVQGEENSSSVIFSHTYCLEKLNAFVTSKQS